MKAVWSSDKRKCMLRYAELERRIQQFMRPCAGAFCSACKDVCCDPDICREAHESAFLIAVRDVAGENERYDESAGWWRENCGCAISAGRPPVCYGFFCDALLAVLRPAGQVDCATGAGRLINKVGGRCYRGQHLVVADSEQELENVNWERLSQQLGQAEAQLSYLVGEIEL